MEVSKTQEFNGHMDAIYTLCAGMALEVFYSAGGDGQIVEWEKESDKPGKVIARLPSAIYSLRYLAESKTLLAASRGGSLYFLDLENKVVTATIETGSTIFSTEKRDNQFYAGKEDGTIDLFSVSERVILSSNQISEKSCRSLSISPGGDMLATGWSDNSIHIFHTEGFKEIATWKAHESSVFCLSWTPDGKYLISGGRDARLKIWEAEHDFDLMLSIPAHLYTINTIDWNPAKSHFATGSRDKTVKIWNGKTFELEKVIDRAKFEAHAHSVNALLWEEKLYSAGDDRKIMAWDIQL